MSRGGAATELVRRAEQLLGFPLPVRVRAWDGSEAGAPARPGEPVVMVRSRRALRHLVWQPGELGLARAYVRGDLDVDGDLGEALSRVWAAHRGAGARGRPSGREVLRAAGTAVRLRALGPRPRPPAAEARLRGRLHSRPRDRAAISHHYDLSNDFYALLLDSRMTYSCGYWVHETPGFGLEEAQRAKLDLVCRKVGLQHGDHLVDVGCGWGALTLHAAAEYGARVTAVTLSAEQRDHVERHARRLGVEAAVDVRLEHYRDLEVTDGADAVVSLEMGEHVGDEEYVGFAAAVHALLRPGGRALVQQMSRGTNAPGGGAFIERYIAPDMHMRPVQQTLGLFADAGLEIRHVEALREHYPQTVRAWARRLEQHWADAVGLVGEETARVWRLYLAGGALAFDENRMGVDQLLLVRPTREGRSLMPPTPAAWALEDPPATDPRTAPATTQSAP